MNDANLLLGILILVFNAGGFVWLSRNHFHRLTVDIAKLQGSVDSILRMLTDHERRISRQEGVELERNK